MRNSWGLCPTCFEKYAENGQILFSDLCKECLEKQIKELKKEAENN